MAGWVWWLIWSGLVVATITFFGYVAYELIGKTSRLAVALEETQVLAHGLVEASQKAPALTSFEGNLLDDPAPLSAQHQRNLKKRELKRQARQRRLINRLIDYDESEFKP